MAEGRSPLFAQVEGMSAASAQECRLAVIDITERKRAEAELRHAQEAAEVLRREKDAAEATSRAKSQFLAMLSHELRTPMTGLLGLLQLTLEEDLTPVLRGYLENTLSSAHSLLRVLSDILDMSKIAAGKLAIVKEPFSPRMCITEAIDIITPDVRRKGLELMVSVAEEVSDIVIGDKGRLRQILINLISNAVKFTKDRGKVEVRVTAGRQVLGKQDFIFSVTDTGIGIPDDKKELLFQAFSQIDTSSSRRYGGTGLGLAISKELVELMGGTLGFESEEGRGSTFFFTIPLGEPSGTLAATGSPAPEWIPASPQGKRRVRLLVAEDNPVTRQLLGLWLKRSDFDLDFADDGHKTVEMWEKGDYDLVLMDVQMPLIDGLQATRIIRGKEQERGGHTPIVALTAHSLKEDEEKCLAAGMDAYISKPIDFRRCVEVIRDFTG